MQFHVPQFIEVEDKIFGPLSFKQFVYVLGGAGLAYLAFRFIPFPINFLVILAVASLAGALAFYKVNNKPFAAFLEAMFIYYRRGKMYIWQKRKTPTKKPEEQESEMDKTFETLIAPRISESKLKDISWSLEVNDTK